MRPIQPWSLTAEFERLEREDAEYRAQPGHNAGLADGVRAIHEDAICWRLIESTVRDLGRFCRIRNANGEDPLIVAADYAASLKTLVADARAELAYEKIEYTARKLAQATSALSNSISDLEAAASEIGEIAATLKRSAA